MKQRTTNYYNTLIEVAEDCPVRFGEAPPDKEPKSVARQEYEMLVGHPYHYTSDEVIFAIKGKPKGLSREEFFTKGQPCLRASALTKRYGWGVHSDDEGRIALYAIDSPEYQRLAADPNVTHLQALHSGKKQV